MLDSSNSFSPRARAMQKNFWRAFASFFVLLFFGPPLVRLYADALWFDSLGYHQLFARSWQARLLLFIAFFALTFAILKTAFALLSRAYAKYALEGVVVKWENGSYPLSARKILRPAGNVLAPTMSLFFALFMGARWQEWLLFWNQTPSADRDAIFQKPLNFYFFTWPIYAMLASWLAWLSVLIFLVAIAWAAFAFLARQPREAARDAQRTSFFWCSISLAGVLAVLALRVYLSRFALVWSDGDIFSGVGYLETHVVLPSLWILIGVLLAGATLLVYNALRGRSIKIFAVVLLAPILVQIATGLIGNYVSNFVVKPNELQLQTAYLQNNMNATRRAFKLENIESRNFAVSSNAAFNSARDASTLDNVRLWDWRALQAALGQTQALKAFYDFPDVDVDRYIINGKPRQVMIAARELDVEKIPSRNWINEKLIYTHGYGLVMSNANGFTPDGRPRFVVSEMPLRSSAPEIKVTRPEIYFGQKTNDHVYVSTRQQEYDYPRDQGDDKYTAYQGEGGIELGSGARRFLLASALGDLSKIPFSSDVSATSRVLMHRQILERAQLLAPFLLFDGDPYLVVTRTGRLVWMLDAYTSSQNYPNAKSYAVAGDDANYLRGSVKVTIDAYDGATHFYVFDPSDAIIAAWQKTFPDLLQDASQMPADLRAHVRYPEGLFRVQSEVFGLYHTTDATRFFSRNDVWNVAQLGDVEAGDERALPVPQAPGIPAAGGMMFPVSSPASSAMEPYFLLMTLPDEKTKTTKINLQNANEFVLTVPFTPNARASNLAAWLAGRSDGANYGTLRSYQFAGGVDVAAPQQIRTRIKQKSALSGQITLWNQQKSGVLWGNLLAIPVGKGLLYVQPIFLRADENEIPQLQLVILATQDDLVYAPTYEEALKKLLGIAPASEPSTPATIGAPKLPSPSSPSITRAAELLSDYQRLTSQGKYGEAGQKLEALKKSLEALQHK